MSVQDVSISTDVQWIEVVETLVSSHVETLEELSLTTNVYAEIKKRLVERGVRPEEIAFIHDARKPEQRAAMFEAVNEGRIRILIGSTEKMGTGMNAQERLIALHHLDAPWRPTDIEQRRGRMLRQGNKHPEVFEFAEVTSGSFDGYVWQTLENKAQFIAQFMRGTVAGRETEDISETVLTFSEIKALASGNPRVVEKVVMDSEIARLEHLRCAWLENRLAMQRRAKLLSAEKERLEKSAEIYTAALQTRSAHGSIFVIRLQNNDYTEREPAGRQVRRLVSQATYNILKDKLKKEVIGSYKGFDLVVTVSYNVFKGEAVPSLLVDIGGEALPVHIGESDLGIIQSIEAQVRSLDDKLAGVEKAVRQAENNLTSIQVELDQSWEYGDKYLELKRQVEILNAELQESETETPEISFGHRTVTEQSDDIDAVIRRIEAMHADPAVLARFELDLSDAPLEISPDALTNLEDEIAKKQLHLAFGQAILKSQQASWEEWLERHGGKAAVKPRRAAVKTPKSQLSMF
ncbi:MAG: helicase C-terminal domain-containing protein [Chloroflexi bacterium]|nr:helicase C-terminal domain-containing protein [Chloroflexota bacterium]